MKRREIYGPSDRHVFRSRSQGGTLTGVDPLIAPHRLWCVRCGRSRARHLDGKVAVRNDRGVFVERLVSGLCPIGDPPRTFLSHADRRATQAGAAAHARSFKVIRRRSRAGEAVKDIRAARAARKERE